MRLVILVLGYGFYGLLAKHWVLDQPAADAIVLLSVYAVLMDFIKD